MAVLFTNISWLVNVREQYCLLRGKDLADLPIIAHAYLVVEGEVI
jgi:imidazolonepropionase